MFHNINVHFSSMFNVHCSSVHRFNCTAGMPLFDLCDTPIGTRVAVLPGVVHAEVDAAVCSDGVLLLDWHVSVVVQTAVLAGCFTGVDVTGE